MAVGEKQQYLTRTTSLTAPICLLRGVVGSIILPRSMATYSH